MFIPVVESSDRQVHDREVAAAATDPKPHDQEAAATSGEKGTLGFNHWRAFIFFVPVKSLVVKFHDKGFPSTMITSFQEGSHPLAWVSEWTGMAKDIKAVPSRRRRIASCEVRLESRSWWRQTTKDVPFFTQEATSQWEVIPRVIAGGMITRVSANSVQWACLGVEVDPIVMSNTNLEGQSKLNGLEQWRE